MAIVKFNGQVVGDLLIDPAGTNMGINWKADCPGEVKDAAWNKFMELYPTGSKIENKDITL